jgi:RNA polymerase sigma factor (sigma-70 family)
MSPDEEASLLENQEKSRLAMLESILSVPLGRGMFTGPLEKLAAGERCCASAIDGSYWNLSDGYIPPDRRGELRKIIDGMKGPYLKREAIRRLHPLWHSVEDLGREVFSGIPEYRELLLRRSRIMDLLGNRIGNLEVLATDYDLLEKDQSEAGRKAWRFHPALCSLQNSLDLLEVRTGIGLLKYSDAGKRFAEAVDRIRDIIERFVEANLCLVISRVRRFHPCDALEEMDLVQEGCQGLMEAVRRFDVSRGCKLSTFAVWWIRQFIMKALIRHGRLVRLPVRLHYEDSSIRRAMDEFALEHGHGPTLEELADFMGRDRRELEDVCLSTAQPLSLDHTDSENDATIADFLESRFQPPDRRALSTDIRERIETALTSLSDREKTIITLRFGLMDDEPCTLAQLGRIFGVSRERIRQIESAALVKLRNHGLLSTLESGGE